MANVIEATYSVKNFRIGIVVSRFNELITKALLEGALNELRRFGISDVNIAVVWVPGAHEIPLSLQTLAQTKKLHALIAIGCIVRGETSHYEHLAQSVADSIQKVALGQNIPIGFGLITVENMAQAIDRSGGKHGNKGRDAARSAVEMADIINQLKNSKEKEARFKSLVEQEIHPVRNRKTF